MRIVCFYTHLAIETARSIAEFAPDIQFIETPKEDHFRYVEEMRKLWDGSDSLLVIEQDKVLTAETIPSIKACPRDWCSFHYPLLPPPLQRFQTGDGLGCTKFSARAQLAAPPDEWAEDNDASWYVCAECGGKSCWRGIDTRICWALRKHEISVHDHGPIVHAHDPEQWQLALNDYREHAESLRGPIRNG